MVTRFEEKRSELVARVKLIKGRKRSKSFSKLLEDWCEVYNGQPFCKLKASFDPRLIFPNRYGNDELVFCCEFDFWDPAYLREISAPGPDCLAGERNFPIGGVDGTDKFVYIGNDLKLGIAIVHYADIFSADDVDNLVERKARRTGFPLASFVESLIPRTEKTIIGVPQDGSRWMILEKRGKTVSCEMSMSESWLEETECDTHKAAWEHYMQAIRDCRKKNGKLCIISCPDKLTSKISPLLQ